MYIKFDYSGFSHSKDTIGGPKIQMGHVTLTTRILRVICFENR